MDDELWQLKSEVRELKRVVAELCERSGIAYGDDPKPIDPAGRTESAHRATCAGCTWCSPAVREALEREAKCPTCGGRGRVFVGERLLRPRLLRLRHRAEARPLLARRGARASGSSSRARRGAMKVDKLKRLAAAVRAHWRNSPRTKLVEGGMSSEGHELLAAIEALPAGAVLVDRATLERWCRAFSAAEGRLPLDVSCCVGDFSDGMIRHTPDCVPLDVKEARREIDALLEET